MLWYNNFVEFTSNSDEIDMPILDHGLIQSTITPGFSAHFYAFIRSSITIKCCIPELFLDPPIENTL